MYASRKGAKIKNNMKENYVGNRSRFTVIGSRLKKQKEHSEFPTVYKYCTMIGCGVELIRDGISRVVNGL